jgi:hypothetical protein
MARLLFAALIALGLVGGAFAPGMAYAQIRGPGPESQPVDGECPNGMLEFLEPVPFPQAFAILGPGCYRVMWLYEPPPPQINYVPVPVPTDAAAASGSANVFSPLPSASLGLPSPGVGASAVCADGTVSFSANASGTCSGYGGVRYSGPNAPGQNAPGQREPQFVPSSSSAPSDGCGSRGGPGYRLSNGQCASWEDARRGRQ